jgi:hypothetical protein
MRAVLAVVVALAGAGVLSGGSEPAAAWDQFSVPDYRSNFVYRPWGQRYTYRRTVYDGYHTLLLGPRNHFRLRRRGIDLQLRDRPSWEPRVEAEPLK